VSAARTLPLEPDVRDLRPLDDGELTAAWQALAMGRWSIVSHFDERGRRHLVAVPCRRPPRLTAREREIVVLVATGAANKAIAFDLGVATSTVSVHLANAMRKLGVHSRVALVARWSALPRAGR
jgi:DNA-binding NarL/FixJ family response regulator